MSKENEIKVTQPEKKRLKLFAYDSLTLENYKESTKKLLEPVNKFRRLQDIRSIY